MDPNLTNNATPVHEGKPYFMGDQALVKFTSMESGFGPDVYWIADKKMHTLRPFESHAALQNAFGDGLETALQHVVSVSPPTVDTKGEISDGILRDFNILSPDYSIKEDGSAKQLHFSPHQLRSRYGKPVNPDGENNATEKLDGFLSVLKQQENDTGIKANFIDSLKRDHHLMAFYISAMTYGGYGMEDVYKDISRRSKREDSKK